MMLVQEFLERSADWFGNKTALVFENQRLTYRQIETRANCLANALRARGLGRGQRVVLWLPNCVELVVGIFGVLKAGGTFIVVNYSIKPQKLAYIVHNCQAQGLLTMWQKRGDAGRIRDEVEALKTIVIVPPSSPRGASTQVDLPSHDVLSFDDIYAHSSDRPPHINIDLDLACLIYTGDSTGESKGVMSDHSNVVFAASSIIQVLCNVPDDVVINVLPLSFDYGLYQLLTVFKFGGTLILERGFSFPALVLRRMETERVTGFPGLPTVFARLSQMDLDGYNLGCVRYLTSTVAPFESNQVATLQHVFPQARLWSMYGWSEAKCALYLPPHEANRHPSSAGIAMPGTEVWLEDEKSNRLAPGQIGQMVVRGRHVMRGYWGDDEATRHRFRSSHLAGERLCYTGDLFSMDEEGFFYFVTHRNGIIKCGGEEVAPKEVEAALLLLEGVQDAAVVGVPDPILGQAIKVFVATDCNKMTEGQVLAHCRQHLGDRKVPKYAVLCNELPRIVSDKVQGSAPD